MVKSEAKCCHIGDAEHLAEWVVYAVEPFVPYNETFACSNHVGEMLEGPWNRVDTIDSMCEPERTVSET
jgi:hypothetical protein